MYVVVKTAAARYGGAGGSVGSPDSAKAMPAFCMQFLYVACAAGLYWCSQCDGMHCFEALWRYSYLGALVCVHVAYRCG